MCVYVYVGLGNGTYEERRKKKEGKAISAAHRNPWNSEDRELSHTLSLSFSPIMTVVNC